MNEARDDTIPFHKKMSTKFLTATALLIVVIELVLWYLSIYGLRNRVMFIIQAVIDHPATTTALEIEKFTDDIVNQLLPTYTRNIALMVVLIIAVVLSGIYGLFHLLVQRPVSLLVEHNRQTGEGTMEYIDEEMIPDNEIGLIMRSRNDMLDAIDSFYSDEAIETLVEAVDAKDRYTHGHSRRVGQFAHELAKKLNLSSNECERVERAGVLHDIGKIGVPDHILTKSGRLSEDEYRQVKEHPSRGRDIIQFSAFSGDVLDGIKYHHEQFDGSGYPEGLRGEEIPLFGRIIAVADAVDAMLSNRSYRDALGLEKTRSELDAYSGRQFDPDMARVALDILTPDFAEELWPHPV